jgi:nicotinate-nucleotide adenylyltransferase
LRLGVFGGSFDPPHNGHLALCLYARELLNLDRIIISVSKNPFKATYFAPQEDREELADLLAAEINLTGATAEVSRWELSLPGASFTIDLLHHLRTLHPNDRLTLLVGEDSYGDMSRWKSIGEFGELCDVAVFRRRGHSAQEPPVIGGSMCFIDFELPLSATDVRALVAAGLSTRASLPTSVARYIEEHTLYR